MAQKKKSGDKPVVRHDGRLTPPMKIVSRVGELMASRGVNGQRLHEMTGVAEDTITKLKRGTWQGVRRRILARIAAALDADVRDLFVALPADIWFPIRRHRRVTVHFGSTSLGFLEGRSGPTEEPGDRERQFIGVWDHRAFSHVYSYLRDTSAGSIDYEFEEHEIGGGAKAPTAEEIRNGNHIVFGSPVVNPFAEQAVCHAREVTRHNPDEASKFPFNFRWQKTRQTVSSFGSASASGDLGIVATGSQELVARRTVVRQGKGYDCGLIMTYRFSPRARDRRVGDEDDDYIIIVIMGNSGCGTLAGTELICDDEEAARALYPIARDEPVFRVCTATYTRDPSAHGDNRAIRDKKLLDAD
jgi:DNA-binding Xre family transcriptional regulator